MKVVKGSFLNKLIYSFIIVLFPAILVGILGPLEIFSGNSSELFFGTNDFFWMFLAISCGIVFLLSLVLAAMPDKVRTILHTLIFSASLMAYIQNMFLNKQLMKTDGSKVDWELYKNYTIIDSIIWILAILVFIQIIILLKDKKEKVMLYGTIFISLVQVVAVISLLITSPYKVSRDKMYVLSNRDEFTVASKENIIVLILDRYGNITFDNSCEADEQYLDIFKDFTYYTNANSKYNYTFPSIPYMLTHYEPDCTKTTNDYKEKAWTEGNGYEFYNLLQSKGYTYNFYTGSGRACFLDAEYLLGNIDNVEERDGNAYKIDYKEMFYLFAKTSLYKYAPYVIKPKLEVQSFFFDGIVSFEGEDFCVEDNGKYYKKLCDDGLSTSESMEKAVIITHLSGIHTPYTINEFAENVDESETSLMQVKQGINVMLKKYFDELKRLDVYDNATIIITADHGEYKDELDPQPIFLIKRAHQNGDKVSYNDAPISSEDLMPTILYLAGIDSSEYGTPIFEIYEDEERERQCMYPSRGYEVFTYTGNRDTLKSMIENDEYTRIDATEDWD